MNWLISDSDKKNDKRWKVKEWEGQGREPMSPSRIGHNLFSLYHASVN